MTRWSDIQNGRVDLVADDFNADTRKGWELYRVLLGGPDDGDEVDRAFVVRLTESRERVRMEIHMDIADAVKRCMEWMG